MSKEGMIKRGAKYHSKLHVKGGVPKQVKVLGFEHPDIKAYLASIPKVVPKPKSKVSK